LAVKEVFEVVMVIHSMPLRINVLSLILALLVVCFFTGEKALAQEGGKPFLQLTVKGKKIRAEVVQTEEEKAKGLMFRESLGKDEGMLFVYAREEGLTFWMKNTPLPLSIAFLDQRGKIVDIQDMEPFSLQTHASVLPAKYALEMNQGWFKKNGIKVGDVVSIPAAPKK
jgi:uncharacterized membrane protein (UPF0127 family)